MRQVLISVLVAGLMGCAVSAERSDEGSAANNEAAASANSCRWKCNKCPPGRACTQTCEQIGNCGLKSCNVIALCIQGYVWDEKACQCVPDGGSPGEACGTSTCPSGQVCCNSSCGICTDPGGVCIQIACAPAL
jgi:hypothetical protein